MQKRIVSSVAREIPWRSQIGTEVIETEVRDHIVAVAGMLGQVAVPNPMRMKQIGEKPSRIARRTTANPTWPIRCCLLVVGAVIAVIDHANQTENGTSIGRIATDESHLLAMTEIEGRGMMNGIDCIEEEVTPGEALMTCPTVMRNPVEAGDEGLTVILKVRAAEETLRFVVPLRASAHLIPILKGAA
jgi:hypothetical protein